MSEYKAKFIVMFFTELIVFISEGKQSANLPPWITSVFEPEYYVPAKHPIPFILKCEAKNGIISYQWFKNNVKLQTNDRVVVNGESGEIAFQNLTKEDFGMYYCLAHNEFGSSVSSFVKLNKAAPAAFRGEPSDTVTCEMFHYCKIPCSKISDCQPSDDCKLEWKSGEGTGTTLVLNRNIAIDSEGNSHFLNFNKSYEKQKLSFGIWNKNSRTLMLGTSYTVLSKDNKSENNNTVTSKAIWKNNPEARIGQNANLQCIFSGSPVPNTHWLLGNGSVVKPNSKYHIKENGRQLFIWNVTFDDEGVYTCVAKNNLTMKLYLNVTTPPIFVEVGNRFMMKLIQLSHIEDTEIQCNAISATNESEPVVIKWMKNGGNINKDPLYWFSEKKKNLHIGNKVPISENGDCFTCVIENSEGIGVANYILIYKHKDQRYSFAYQRVNYVVITVCSITLAILIILGVIIIRKKVICKTKVNNISEEDNEAKKEHTCTYSDPVIELSENMCNPYCGVEESYDTPQMMSFVDDPESDYNTLRENKVEKADKNLYDCAENVSGIYVRSFQRNPYTTSGFSDDLKSLESCSDT